MTPTVSAICPVRNEADSITHIFETFPSLNAPTELVFVEGGSVDSTWQRVKSYNGLKNNRGVLFRAVKQVGKGKAAAIITGFNQAQGKYLLIADADMSVPPRDLKKILKLFSSYGDDIVACGNRLAGLPKPKAFYWLNYVGNYFFRYYYSLILGSSVKDIACGSKAVTKATWKKIKRLQEKEGILDSWGDIDWLYYGKRVGCSLHFASVVYLPRKLGESKLQDLKVRYAFALKILMIGFALMSKRNETV